MSENQHSDFDQFFKGKFDNREFDFKDTYWAEMEQLMTESESNKDSDGKGLFNNKRIPTWMIGGTLFVVLITLGWLTITSPLNNPANNPTKKQATSRTENLSIVDADAAKTTEKKTVHSTHLLQKNKPQTNASKRSLNQNRTTTKDFTTTNKTKTTLQNAELQIEKPQHQIHSNSSKLSKSKIDRNYPLSQVKSKPKSKWLNLNKSQSSQTIIKQKPQTQTITPRNIKLSSQTNIQTKSIRQRNETSLNQNTTTVPSKKQLKQQKNFIPKASSSYAEPSQSNPTFLSNSKNNRTNNVKNTIKIFTIKSAIQAQDTLTQKTTNQPITPLYQPKFLETKQWGFGQADTLNILKPQYPKRLRWSLGIALGMNTSLGFYNGQPTRAALSNTPLAAVHIGCHLNNTWSLHTAVSYYTRGGLNSLLRADSTIFGFSALTFSTTVKTTRLHYVEIPLYVQYQRNRHVFIAGGYMSYLLNSTSEVGNSLFNSATASWQELDTSREWGYSSGFSRHDFGLTVGYDYQIIPNLKVGGRMNYGLNDITNDAIYTPNGGNNIFDKNLQFRLMLTYQLLY